MREFQVVNKTYVKATNSSNKMIARYTYSLIVFTFLTIIINLFLGNNSLVISLIKSVTISILVTSLITYVINVFRKKYDIRKVFLEDTTIAISLMLGLFGTDIEIYILVLAIIITLIIKNVIKNINLSAVLYGLLVIMLYRYYTNDLNTPLMVVKDNMYSISFDDILKLNSGKYHYLFGINYLSPILSIIAFVYLFYKKGIKYNLVASYILSISMIMLMYGVLTNKMWFVLFELCTGSLLFLTIYTLADYMASPTIAEAQILYGIVLGIMTAILRFVIPELAVIVSFIMGQLLLSNFFDKISYKLKINKKLYNLLIIISVAVIIITIAILVLVY